MTYYNRPILLLAVCAVASSVYYVIFNGKDQLEIILGRWKTEDKFSYIEKRFERRLRNLREFCKHHFNSTNLPKRERPFGFYTVPKKHLLMCEVPKSGTSTWNRFFWDVERSFGAVKDVPYDHKYLEKYRASAWEWIGDNENEIFRDEDDQVDGYFKRMGNESYHRAIMARHPFGRLISGWNDKYTIGSSLIEHYMELKNIKKFINEKPLTNHTMSWPDFARYIAENGPRVDLHFQWNYYLCQTCNYNYSYVVKLETLDEDKQWLGMQWNVSNFSIGHENYASSRNEELNYKSTAEKIESMMELLPLDVVDKLYKIFEVDFKIFGYTFENMKAGGFD